MFETIREFALEQLEVGGEIERWSQSHLAYFLELVERAEVDLQETAPVSTVWHTRRRLSPERGNLRAALTRATAQTEGEAALRLAGSMCALWVPALNLPVTQRWLDQSAGTMGEARRWLELALAMDTHASEAVRAKALYGLGRVLLFHWDEWDNRQSELDYAVRMFEESLVLSRRRDDRRAVIRTLIDLGWALYQREQFASATAVFQESLTLSLALNVHADAGWSLIGLGRIEMEGGDSAKAAPLLQQGLDEQRRAGNRLGVAAALDALGLCCQSQREYARAKECFEEAVALRRGVGAESGLPPALQRLAAAVAAGGDLTRGVALNAESLVLSQRMGSHPSDLAIGLLSLGQMAGTLGLLEHGARLIGAAEALFGASGMTVPSAFRGLTSRTVANVRRALGDEAFEAAIAAGRTLPLRQAIAEAMQVAAEATRGAPPD